MPKNIPVAQIEEKNQLFSDKAYLVLLHIEVKDVLNDNTTVEDIYLVNNDEDIVFNGQTYYAFNFTMEFKSEYGSQPNISLSLQDITRTVQYRMQEYNGGVGSIINIVVVNENDLDAPAEIVERFEVIDANVANYNITWSLGTVNLLAFKFPNRVQIRDRCSWKYKDPDTCAYSGPEETCDYTLQGDNGCAAKNNEENFGGFPGLRTIGATYV